MAEVRRTPRLWTASVRSVTRADGTVLVWQDEPLAPGLRCIGERFAHWAQVALKRIWMAERAQDRSWRTLTYGEAFGQIRAIAAALLARGLSVERPLLILSANSIAHALIALAAQHVGIPSAAIAPAYGLAGSPFAKLRQIARQLTPGMLFAEDAAQFAPAITEVFDPSIPVVAVKGEVPDRCTLRFDDLAATPAGPEVDAAHAAITPDTIAKFLFTSGTTGAPKAVIQTQRMLCTNQQMVLQCYAFLADTPPVVVDWAPWSHTAAGNKVFNMVIWNGGSYWIDDGRPVPDLFHRTIANLREISPTWSFNVPVGYLMLADALERDPTLRQRFFARLQMMMYAGADMSQPLWERLMRLAEASVPGGVLLCTGFGSTETGPFALMCTEPQQRPGNIGIPAHGVTLKLVPIGDGRYEARVQSPSVTPGYWRDAELTAKAFDEEGFYRFGDAVTFAVSGRPEAGFFYAGRLAENFKLASGTWVAVGEVRAKLLSDLRGLARDAVITGENREELGALLVPDVPGLRQIAGEEMADAAALLAHPAVRRALADRLTAHAAAATGSASRVVRVLFLAEPLSFDRGEVTDKGSINQRAVLRNRSDLVERLYSGDPAVVVARPWARTQRLAHPA